MALLDFSWRHLYAESTAIAITTEGGIGLDAMREMPFDEYEWVRREIPRMVREAMDAKRN